MQFYQMKQMNSRNPQAAAANPQMQQMQKFFPIIFGVIYLKSAAGATIYMVVSSAMRIGTQELMFRSGMVTPVAAEREIGSAKDQEKEKPPLPKPPKKTSAATDGTAAAKATLPPAKSGGAKTNGAKTNGRTARERQEADSGKAGGERQGGERPETASRTNKHRSPIRGRGPSEQERLDNVWRHQGGGQDRRRGDRTGTGPARSRRRGRRGDRRGRAEDGLVRAGQGRSQGEGAGPARRGEAPPGAFASERRQQVRTGRSPDRGNRQGGQRSSSGGAPRNGSETDAADTEADGSPGPPGFNGSRHSDRRTGSGTSRSARRRRNRSNATTTGVASVQGSRNGSGGPSPEKAPQRSTEAKETEDMAEGMTLEEQGEVGRAFVADLLSEFSMEGRSRPASSMRTRSRSQLWVRISRHPGRAVRVDAGRPAGSHPGRCAAPMPIVDPSYPGRRLRPHRQPAVRRRCSGSAWTPRLQPRPPVTRPSQPDEPG